MPLFWGFFQSPAQPRLQCHGKSIIRRKRFLRPSAPGRRELPCRMPGFLLQTPQGDLPTPNRKFLPRSRTLRLSTFCRLVALPPLKIMPHWKTGRRVGCIILGSGPQARSTCAPFFSRSFTPAICHGQYILKRLNLRLL